MLFTEMRDMRGGYRLGWEGKIKGSSFVMLILRYLSDSQKKMVSRLVLARAAVKKYHKLDD